MTSELAAIDWLGHGWLLLLAFTVAVLLVAALRKPCRRLFGTERAFQLWLLPPLAILASQLPHVADTGFATFPAVVYVITSVGGALPADAGASTGIAWRTGTVLLWFGGMLASLFLAAWAQRRYRRQLIGATSIIDLPSRWPVLRATRADVGPALIGAWRCRIVLPCDFEKRYSDAEQVLILAHENMHARRRDGWWCLSGRVLAGAFWFHPLAWWAMFALRHDQELACDAAVLREHGAQRRSYAQAMLKTQSAAFALPVGCPWSPRHPVAERIAMLKLKQPNAMRRGIGVGVVTLIAATLASVVYAATPTQPAPGLNSHSHRYTLKMELAVDGKPARLHATTCLKPGQYYYFSVTESSIGQLPPWQGRFMVVPAEHGELQVQGELSGGSLAAPSYPKLRMLPGQHGTIQVGQQAHKQGQMTEDHTIKIDVTPSIGC